LLFKRLSSTKTKKTKSATKLLSFFSIYKKTSVIEHLSNLCPAAQIRSMYFHIYLSTDQYADCGLVTLKSAINGNSTNTARANLIKLARDLLLSNFIISKIESLENSMCFCFDCFRFFCLS